MAPSLRPSLWAFAFDGHNRFLCFKSGRADKCTQVTVIYMEGTLRSLDKMNEILK